LIPNFNKGKYLEECIRSVLNQTTDEWQCIIVDDGSTDGSRHFFTTSPLMNDPRIHVHYNLENLGNAKTLNKLVDLARTDIVGILDSDDVLEPKCIEKLLLAYRESYKGFVYTNFWYCDSNLKKENKGSCARLPEGGTALEHDCVSAFRTFRVVEYRKTGGVDETLKSAVDKDMIYRLEEVTELHFIDEPLYLYRKLPSSLSNGDANRQAAKENHGRAIAAAKLRRKK
jgi:glycosyltransferase involved in cell wall biosynthesis